MLIHHRRALYGFGIAGQDKLPVGIFTVLSINEMVGDCAAYEGVGPYDADEIIIQRIKAGGNKITEKRARTLFPEIEQQGLRYRR